MATTATATVNGDPAKHVAMDMDHPDFATQLQEGVDTYVTKPAQQVHRSGRDLTRAWFKSPVFHLILICVLIADLAIVLTEICLDIYYPEKESEEEVEVDGMFVTETISCPEIPHAVERAHEGLKWTSVSLLIILVFEQLAKIWAFGAEYFKKWGNYLDATVVVASLVLELVLTGQAQSVAALLIFLRLIRVMHAIYTITQGLLHDAHLEVEHHKKEASMAHTQLRTVRTRLDRMETSMASMSGHKMDLEL